MGCTDHEPLDRRPFPNVVGAIYVRVRTPGPGIYAVEGTAWTGWPGYRHAVAVNLPEAAVRNEGAVTMANLTRSPAARRGLAVLVAVVATLVVWVVEVPLLGFDLRARPVPGVAPVVVAPAAVAFVTLLAGLVAWGLLAMLERVTPLARRIWTIVAVVVFLISLIGPLGGGVTVTAAVGLACMHLVAAVVLIPLLARSATPGRSLGRPA
jgi:hypothetical protein